MEAVFNFRALAQEQCNGSELMNGTKLETEDILDKELTIEDFDLVIIDDKEVSVITFVEEQDKYYFGGQSLTKMVVSFEVTFDSIKRAREEYEKSNEKIVIIAEKVRTKKNNDFIKITVL